MMHVVAWFVQDLLTVLTWGTLQMPELFLYSLVYRLLTRDRDINVSIIWSAFIGGLFWDLRWVGIPGFFTLTYTGAVLIAMWVWNNLPVSGRTPVIVFLLLWGSQMVPAVLPFPFLGRNVGSTGWAAFMVQQGCMVPLALLGVFFYFRHMKDQNA